MPFRKNPVPRLHKSLLSKDEASNNTPQLEEMETLQELAADQAGLISANTGSTYTHHTQSEHSGQQTTLTRHRNHLRRRSHGWQYRIRKFLGIPGKSRTGSKNKILLNFNTILTGVKKLVGFPEKVKKLPKELFLKTDENGEYKIVKARVITTIGMEEENLPNRPHQVAPGYKHRKGIKQKFSLKRISHYLFFWRKKQQPSHHRHSALRHKAVETTTQSLNKESLLPIARKRRNNLLFRNISTLQLVKSWLQWNYLLKLVSSAALFMVAYIFTWFIYSLTTIFVASFYNINAVMYYYEVMWPEGNAIPPWSDFIAIIVTLSGPMVSLFSAGIYFLLLKNPNWAGNQIRTLVFWLFVNSLLHFFGAFAAGVITWEGFGYVLEWIHLHTFFLFLFATLFLSVLVFIGWKYTRFILEVRPLRKHGSSIPMILINRMVLPYLLGTLILLALKIPNGIPQHPYIYDYEALILASGLLMMVPPLFNTRLKPLHRTHKNLILKQQKIYAGIALFLSVCMVLLYRVGLSNGLYIHMKFAINIFLY